MGWNALDVTRPSELLEGLDGEDVYFAHSYAVEPAAPDVTVAQVEHDGVVVAAVEQGALAGVQFHPGAQRPGRRAPARERGAMVKKRVIPCLDVAGGRVVKGVRFENLRDVGDPIELATRYSELAADELVFLDITATLEDRGPIARARRARRRGALDPVHRRRRRDGARRRSRAPARRCGQGGGEPCGLRRSVDADGAGRRVRLAGGRLRSRRAGGRGGHARGQEPRGRDAVELGRGGGRDEARARSC